MYSKRFLLLLSALALLISAPACRRENRVVVGVVPKGASHIFWQTVHAGAIKASQEYGFEIEWNAPVKEVDSSRQIEIVESMVNRRLAGIVLAPVDRKALVGVVERAAKAGIPVAIFDSAIDSAAHVTYVATDNLEGGRLAARRMGQILGGKGKVGIVGFMPGSASTMDREKGFEDELHAKFPGIEVVGLQYNMADRGKAMAIAENMITAHPDLSGLFADNESSSAGAVQALRARRANHIKLVAFDASEQIINELKEGWIDSIVLQNPFVMGYESTKAIGKQLRGEKVEAMMDSGVTIITLEDLDKPAVKEWLYPDIEKYLNAPSAGAR